MNLCLGTLTLAAGLTTSAPVPATAGHPHKHVEIHKLRTGDRAYLGVHLTPLSDPLRAYFEAPEGQGVLISAVEKDSPAERAGLKAGDVIIGLDGKTIESARGLIKAMMKVEKGRSVQVELIRDRSRQTITAQPERRKHRFMGHHPNVDVDFEMPEGWEKKIEKSLKRLDLSELEEKLEKLQERLQPPEFLERLERIEKRLDALETN